MVRWNKDINGVVRIRKLNRVYATRQSQKLNSREIVIITCTVYYENKKIHIKNISNIIKSNLLIVLMLIVLM